MNKFKFTLTVLTLLLVFCISANAQIYGLAHNGSDGPSTLYEIDPTSGAATMIGPTGFERCGGLDYDPVADKLYATCQRNDGSDIGVLIDIDPTTGQGAEIGPLSCNASTDIAIRNGDRTLFGALFNCSEGNFGLALINKNTGNSNFLGDFDQEDGCCGNGMAFSLTDTLYLADDISLYIVNQSNGNLITVTNVLYPGSLVNTPRINAMDLDTSTGEMFVIIVNGGSEYDAPRTN